MTLIPKAPYPEHPDRCQGIKHGQGQCTNLKASHSSFCLCHGGNAGIQAAERKSISNYRLTKWQARLEDKANQVSIKSRRDEIGILRVLMEETLNKCQTDMDLILQCSKIADLAMKIEKLVASCHKLEGSMGKLMDKSAILQFAAEIVEIIGQELQGDEAKISSIGEQIFAAVGRLGGEE